MNRPTQPPAGRILALDLGQRRIGLALSDELGFTAQGLGTLERSRTRQDLAGLANLVVRHGVRLILIGNPRHMDGSEGAQSVVARQFAGKLESRTGVPVVLWDERLTTREAERVLRESRISQEKRRRAVDRVAAVILLQSYLESLSTSSTEEVTG